MSKRGTILVCLSTAGEFSPNELDVVIEQLGINRKLCRTVNEVDALEGLRLLLQQGASRVDALRLGRDGRGRLAPMGQPLRLFG